MKTTVKLTQILVLQKRLTVTNTVALVSAPKTRGEWRATTLKVRNAPSNVVVIKELQATAGNHYL